MTTDTPPVLVVTCSTCGGRAWKVFGGYKCAGCGTVTPLEGDKNGADPPV